MFDVDYVYESLPFDRRVFLDHLNDLGNFQQPQSSHEKAHAQTFHERFKW